MFKDPENAQVGDTVAVYEWTSYSTKVTFVKVTKVTPRKVTVDNGMAFKTSTWRQWGKESGYRSGVKLVDEETGLHLQKRNEEAALCKVIARDANEALAKIDTDRFSRYAMDWNKVDLKNAIGARKQAMLNAVAGFDQMLATLENM